MDLEEKILSGISDSGNRPPKRPLGFLHTFYICGEITEPSDYTEWFDQIRNAQETDIIKLHINSPGGDLFTAIQFMRVLAETSAHVICSVEGACMSAATMIFLQARQFEISEHSMFMFHNYSGLAFGKGGEMIDQLQHERKWSDSIMRKTYDGFLTKDEIDSMLDNKDIWMSGEEVMKRLEGKAKSNTKKKRAASKKK